MNWHSVDEDEELTLGGFFYRIFDTEEKAYCHPGPGVIPVYETSDDKTVTVYRRIRHAQSALKKMMRGQADVAGRFDIERFVFEKRS